MSTITSDEKQQVERVFSEICNAGTVLEQLSADLTTLEIDGNPPHGFIGAVGYLGQIIGALGDLGNRTIDSNHQSAGSFEGWILGQDFVKRQAGIETSRQAIGVNGAA